MANDGDAVDPLVLLGWIKEQGHIFKASVHHLQDHPQPSDQNGLSSSGDRVGVKSLGVYSLYIYLQSTSH